VHGFLLFLFTGLFLQADHFGQSAGRDALPSRSGTSIRMSVAAASQAASPQSPPADRGGQIEEAGVGQPSQPRAWVE